MSVDITQLQAVLSARDEATPVIQNFLNLVRQARDVVSGFGASTSGGLSGMTPEWQRATQAAQQHMVALTATQSAATQTAQAVTGIGQAAQTSGQQATTAFNTAGAAARSMGQQATTAFSSVNEASVLLTQRQRQLAEGFARVGVAALKAAQDAVSANQKAEQSAAALFAAQSGGSAGLRATGAGGFQARAPTSAFGGGTGGLSPAEITASQKAITDLRKSTDDSTAAVAKHSEAWVSLGGVMSHLPGPLGEVGAAFATVHVKITQTEAALLAISAAAITVGSAMLGALSESVHQAGEFQRTFADVQINSEIAGAALDEFKNKAIELGASSQFNSQKIAQGFYELSSAGLNVKETMAAIEPAILAATLGHQQLGQTTLQLASIMRQFGLEAKDITRIVDVETVMARDSLLHWSQLGDAFRNVQGSAKFMNVSLEETGAALEVMANAGTTAAMSGTAFRTFLDRLAKGTGEAGAAMSALNLQMYDSQGKFVGLLPIMQQIEQATAGMTDAEKDGIIAKLGGARANALIRDTLNAKKDVEIEGQAVTLRGTQVLEYFIQRNMDAAGAAQRAGEIVRDTFNFQMERLHATIQEVAIRIGTTMLPALTQLARVGADAVNVFVNAPPAIHAGAAAFLAVGGAATTLMGVLGTLGVLWKPLAASMGTELPAALLTLLPGVTTVGAALASMAGVLTAVAVASAALAIAWSNDWLGIRTATEDAVQNGVLPAISSIREEATNLAVALNTDVLPQIQKFWIDATKPTNIGKAALGILTEGGFVPKDLFGSDEEYEEAASQVGKIVIETIKMAVISSLPGGSFALFVMGSAEVWHASGVTAGQAAAVGFRAGMSATFGVAGAVAADVVLGKVQEWETAASQRGAAIRNDFSQQLQAITDIAAQEGQMARESFDHGFASVQNNQMLGKDMTEAFDLLQPILAEKGVDLGEVYLNAFRSSLTRSQVKDLDAFVVQMARDMAAAAPEFGESAQEFNTRWFDEFQRGLQDRFPTLSPLLINLLRAVFGQQVNSEAYKHGGDYSEQLARGIEAGAGALGAAVARLMAGAKGNISKAITEAIAEGNEAAAAEMMRTQNAQKIISDAIKTTNTDFQAQVLVMEQVREGETQLQAVQRTLDFLYQTGVISLQQYNDALNGTAEGHQKTKTAAQEHKNEINNLIQSTDAASVTAGLYIQHLDAFVDKTAKSLPAIEGQVVALTNAGRGMEAAQLVADALGLSLDTVSAAAQGNTDAIAEVNAAVEKLTGGHKTAAQATKEYKTELQELAKSTDAASVASALYSQQVDKVNNQSLAGMDIQTRAVVQATINAKDEFSAAQQIAAYYGVAITTVTGALEGERLAEVALTEAIRRKTEAQKQSEDAYRRLSGIAGPRDASYKGAVEETIRAYRELGQALPTGLSRGMSEGQSALNQATSQMLAGAEDTVREQWQIASPSQWWADRGRDAIAGLQTGILDSIPGLQSTLTSVLGGVGEAAGGAFASQLGQGYEGVTPLGSPTYGTGASARGIQRAGGTTETSSTDPNTNRATITRTTTTAAGGGANAAPYRAPAGFSIEAARNYLLSLGQDPGVLNPQMVETTSQQIQTIINQRTGELVSRSVSALQTAYREETVQEIINRLQPSEGRYMPYSEDTLLRSRAGGMGRTGGGQQYLFGRPVPGGLPGGGPTTPDAIAQFWQEMNDGGEAFERSLSRSSTRVVQISEEQAQAYAEQREALRQASAETREWRDEVRHSGASAEEQARQLGEYADSLVDIQRTTNSVDDTFRTTQRLLNDLGDPVQRDTSLFTQVGDLSVGLGRALDTSTAAASDFGTRGLGTLTQSTLSLSGRFMTLEERGTLLMAAQGKYIDEFGRLQSRLLDVTAQVQAAGGGSNSSLLNGIETLQNLSNRPLPSPYDPGGLRPYAVGGSAFSPTAIFYGGTGYGSSTAGYIGGKQITSANIGGGIGAGRALNINGEPLTYQQLLQASQTTPGSYQGTFSGSSGQGTARATAGTGHAQHLVFDYGGGFQSTPATAADVAAADTQQFVQAWETSVTNAKMLASGTGAAESAWAGIADQSEVIASSISRVAGAFSAMPGVVLNPSGLSSITGSYTVPTIGGPSGPNPTTPNPAANQAFGNTYGGTSYGALQNLIARVTAAMPSEASADALANAIQQAQREDEEYIRVVGRTTDTLGDLEEQQRRAAQDVQNLSHIYSAAGDGARLLQEAQKRLATATNAVAAATVYNPPQMPGYTTTPMNFNTTGGAVGTSAYYTSTGQTPYNTTITTPGPGGTTLATVQQNPTGTQQAMVNVQGVLIPAGASATEVLAILAAHGVTPENPQMFAGGGTVNGPQLALVGEAGPELIAPLDAGTALRLGGSIMPGTTITRMRDGKWALAGGGIVSGYASGGMIGSFSGAGPGLGPIDPKTGYWTLVENSTSTSGSGSAFPTSGTTTGTTGSTATTTGTTAATTTATAPPITYPRLIGTAGPLDIYQLRDGTVKRVPHGTIPPDTVNGLLVPTSPTAYDYTRWHWKQESSQFQSTGDILRDTQTQAGGLFSTLVGQGIDPWYLLALAGLTNDPKYLEQYKSLGIARTGTGTVPILPQNTTGTGTTPTGATVTTATTFGTTFGSVGGIGSADGIASWNGIPLPPEYQLTSDGLNLMRNGVPLTGEELILLAKNQNIPLSSAQLQGLQAFTLHGYGTGQVPTISPPDPIELGFATGGIAWNPQTVPVAEHGPEVIEKLDDRIARVTGGGSGVVIGDINITIQSQGNAQADVAEYSRQFYAEIKRQGLTLVRRGRGI
jgi:TP901 family phage tail tape measure protein